MYVPRDERARSDGLTPEVGGVELGGVEPAERGGGRRGEPAQGEEDEDEAGPLLGREGHQEAVDAQHQQQEGHALAAAW